MLCKYGNARRMSILLLFKIVCVVFIASFLYNTRRYTKNVIKSSQLYHDTTPVPKALRTIIPQQAWVRYPGVLWHGYELPIITSYPLGRLGNVLMEYASLYAINRLYNVSVLVHPKMAETLKLFDNISLPYVPGRFKPQEWSLINNLERNRLNYAPLQLAASGLLGPHLFMTKQYPQEIQLFDLLRDQILQEFIWNKSIQDMVKSFLKDQRLLLKKIGILEPVFIGLHVRRTDYVKFIKQFGGSAMPDKIYFGRAFEYFKKKYPDAYLIVSSDDQNYIKSELKSYEGSFSLTPGHSPAEDMAILNGCSHSIITVGTFSFWTGYLTGGEVLYPDMDFTDKDYPHQKTYYQRYGLYFRPISIKG